MVSVLTNPGALVATRAFTRADRAVDTVGQRVSTGLKVIGAVDDASNFAIAQGIRGEIKAWSAVRQALGVGGAMTGSG